MVAYAFDILDPELLLQLAMAVVLGGSVGLERELRGRAAGLRTMIIVCLGATLVMVVSTRLPMPAGADAGQSVIRVDPGRIAAGIVTGVGFLGAGVVLKLRDLIRGVTTAACIWFVAGVGIAIGQQMYGVAVLGTGVCLAILWALRFVERRMRRVMYRNLVLTVEAARTDAVLAQTGAALARWHTDLLDTEIMFDKAAGSVVVDLAVRAREDLAVAHLVQEVAAFDGVRRASWGVSA